MKKDQDFLFFENLNLFLWLKIYSFSWLKASSGVQL